MSNEQLFWLEQRKCKGEWTWTWTEGGGMERWSSIAQKPRKIIETGGMGEWGRVDGG